jgi:hypothetical protein
MAKAKMNSIMTKNRTLTDKRTWSDHLGYKVIGQKIPYRSCQNSRYFNVINGSIFPEYAVNLANLAALRVENTTANC